MQARGFGMAKVQSAMIELRDQFLWQAAAQLLEIERLLDGKPQEVSANYDAAAQTCPTFADLGTGGMRALASRYIRCGSKRVSACWRRAWVKRLSERNPSSILSCPTARGFRLVGRRRRTGRRFRFACTGGRLDRWLISSKGRRNFRSSMLPSGATTGSWPRRDQRRQDHTPECSRRTAAGIMSIRAAGNHRGRARASDQCE
jgi:hypothetical protein